MFTLQYSVKMFDTDASGFLFFTSQMRMAHEAYEELMRSAGMGISNILRTQNYLLPIAHAETDYATPSSVGDALTIEVSAERIGDTSFTLFYQFTKPDGTEVGTARTVHVAVDRKSRKAIPLPAEVRSAIEKFRA